MVNDGSCLDSLSANNFIFRHEYTASGEKCAQLTKSRVNYARYGLARYALDLLRHEFAARY